jgi:hypothetical protein
VPQTSIFKFTDSKNSQPEISFEDRNSHLTRPEAPLEPMVFTSNFEMPVPAQESESSKLYQKISKLLSPLEYLLFGINMIFVLDFYVENERV